MKKESIPPVDSYITVRSKSSDEVVIQKSRFIGYVAPCNSEDAALSFIRSIKEKHKDARHHCYAYIVGLNAGIMRYSDDGEPGGTAGMPMMSVLKSEKVVNCCTVVVRYFGGILLGTGGLVRAYTQGCQIALKASGLVRMELSSLLRCKVSYSLWNTVQYLFMKMPVYIRDIEYTDEVTFILVAKKKESETVIGQIRNLTEGKIIIQPLSEEYQAWDL